MPSVLHIWCCPCSSVVLETTHKASWGCLKGTVSTQNASKGPRLKLVVAVRNGKQRYYLNKEALIGPLGKSLIFSLAVWPPKISFLATPMLRNGRRCWARRVSLMGKKSYVTGSFQSSAHFSSELRYFQWVFWVVCCQVVEVLDNIFMPFHTHFHGIHIWPWKPWVWWAIDSCINLDQKLFKKI